MRRRKKKIINTKSIKKKLEQRLFKRGMLKMTTGEVLCAPTRMFENLGEEILWILNQQYLKLTVNELANYLLTDKKVIGKVMRKLTASNASMVKKEKDINSSRFLYSAHFSDDLDISTIYRLTRKLATQKIR